MITVELVARERSWPCRFLRHHACRTAYPSPRAVAYPDPLPRVAVVGWLRCPCHCHGELPTQKCLMHMTPDLAHCTGCAADRLAGETA